MGYSSRRLFIFTLLVAVFVGEINTCYSAKTYVVYMGSKTDEDSDEILRQNHQMLAAVHSGSIEQAQASHVCSYRHGFRGFAAKLRDHQAHQISKMPGVVSVFPNLKRRLHTTHSWDFMGLLGQQTMEIPGHSTTNQVNIVVGFIDTGIWPESPSFDDANMPPVPARWKGLCQTGEAFNASSCNRKVIGARYYMSGYIAEEDSIEVVSFRSPRDSSGHGSHTASTAAGRYVTNMNYKGLAAGGARGGAPMARIAVYKTCWDSGCYDVDLLAAFDDAIRDGVHILSLSLGPDAPQGDYFNDAISVGSFHAASHGVLVVSSVGNEGSRGSATNLAPWMLTVAASSTDRDFTSDIILGDGSNFTGASLSLFKMNASARVISAAEAYAGYFTPYQSSYCLESSLNRTKVRGNVVVCRHAESTTESRLAKSIVVKEAGGTGMILIDEADKDVAIPFVIPSAIVGKEIGDKILSYINHTRKPISKIFPAKTLLGSQPAPRVAAFSSKGPNALTPEILKPDITAPGLNILAAWSPAVSRMQSNILSGTSMACPHVTGIATLIKAVYPSWSPAAIKSAIMTTATILDKNHNHITVDPEGRRGNAFDYGSGFANPRRMLDPGLIYDAEPVDYKAFLCSIGYDEKSLHLITGDNSSCNQALITASALNYPSITVSNLKDDFSVTRTVTNVGKPRSLYKVFVSSPVGINVTVMPRKLIFSNYGQKINFTVHLKVAAPSKGYKFGYLSWRSRNSQVTSPLVVRAEPSDTGLMS
ncbi:Peptidase_S8 domain-containing protein/PA domain-containing protein/Inhibitor_I9 domain-containing protein [Cephalotus follicularis]|uniref:Peptidase_S8 domain-containing protein/PA domain-containing protein/Inhibitor_I9 domain-containing protein n=1 Tax=Cephalotus follicularis TaxID=3775 RepID=A0A1Q3C2H5_CEPFO|nr:Peptidase_S8 domain-containing protein/PA domain-containing protein/Inhibitor_I9 domain-containing protein [Cephalotus follicularis]